MTDMITKEIHVQYHRQKLIDMINTARQTAKHNRDECPAGDESTRVYRAMMTARREAFEDVAYMLGLDEYLIELT